MKVKVPFIGPVRNFATATITPVVKVYVEHKAYARAKAELKAEMIQVGHDLLNRDAQAEVEAIIASAQPTVEAELDGIKLDLNDLVVRNADEDARVRILEQRLMSMTGQSLPEMIAGLSTAHPSIQEFLDANLNKEGSES